MAKPVAPWRRNLVKWVIGGVASLVALGFLLETAQFLVTRKLVRDTFLTWGMGEPIDDARVTVDSCTTVGHTVNSRRGPSYVAYDTDCEVTIQVPAQAPHRETERSQACFWRQDDAKEVLGAGRVGGRLAVRWSHAALWGMWKHVPHILFIVIGIVTVGTMLAVWRWRRWWWHDRFRRRKRF